MTSETTKKSRFEQIRDYILKEAKKNYAYGESIPFSARTFAGWIDEAKQELPKKKHITSADLKAREPIDKATFGELIQGLETLKWVKRWFNV